MEELRLGDRLSDRGTDLVRFSALMPGQRINGQRFSDFLKLRISRDQPGTALDGQFGGKRVGVT